MSALLQAELLKLRTTRTFFALAGSALGLSLVVLLLITLLGSDFSERDVRAAFAFDFTGLFIALLGAIGMAGEWRHRTITSAVLAAPDRIKLISAKAISYAIAGIVVSLVVTLSLIVIGTIILSIRDETTLDAATLLDIVWRNLVVAAYFGALGVAVGAIVRNQIAAIIGLLVFSFMLEPTLFAFAPDAAKSPPLGGAPSGIVNASFDEDENTYLQAGVAALVMCGWVTMLFAAGASLLRRRDLT